MAFQSWTANSSYGSDFSRLFDPFSQGVFNNNGVVSSSPSPSPSQALVLDSEKGELVKAPVRVGKKGVSELKAMAALKSHSEAERRRRERINAHLSTLRGLLPSTEKMDKATLLAEVISQVKELNKNATEASKGFLVPTDTDEVRVESHDDGAKDGKFAFRASLCCDYRPELMSDLRQAINALQLNTVQAEISTLGCRVKNVFIFSSYCKEEGGNNDIDVEAARQILASSIHQALSSVLDKVVSSTTSLEYSPRTTLPNKRRRVSFFDSSSSSS